MSSRLAPGPHNDLTDVTGVRVGHFARRTKGWSTGTTVVLPPPGTTGAVDVRGGGPCTRETDALDPSTLVPTVDAVVLSGGSTYGLAAASGVTDWLGERRRGFPVGPEPHQVVPIVPAACLFDLGAGGRFDLRPDASFGAAAADDALRRRHRPLGQGTVGAGTGAHAGSLKGGVGSASVVLEGGVTVAALVAVNSGGSVVAPTTGALYGLGRLLPGEIPGLRAPRAADVRAARALAPDDRIQRPASRDRGTDGPTSPAGTATNTLLAVVATDATLTKAEARRLAVAGHDGMARAVSPIHTMTDGDVVFALATGRQDLPDDAVAGYIRPGLSRPGQLSALAAAAADTVTRAIVHAVVAATAAGGLPTYLDRYPSARR